MTSLTLKKTLLFSVFFYTIHFLNAQYISPDSTAQSLHSNQNMHLIRLMVVPNFMSNKKIKELSENDKTYKIVIQEISRSLETEGFIVKDYLESLRISEEKYQLREMPLTTPFSILLENAPADIFVYVDITNHQTGAEKQVSIFLKAIDKYTADRFASSSLLKSTNRYWANFQSPALEALKINNGLTNFSKQLKKEVINLIRFGRKIDLKFESVRPNELGLQMMVEEDKNLISIINEWINKHSISNIITIGNSNQILRKEVYIPIFDKNNIVYTPASFGNELQIFLKNYLDYQKIPYNKVISKVVGARVEIWLH